MTKKKNLTRSHKNRILGGVLGGVAEYFGWNDNHATHLCVDYASSFPWYHILYLSLDYYP